MGDAVAKKKRFKFSGPKWQIIGLALLAIVTLGVVIYALTPAKVVALPATTPSATPSVTKAAPKDRAVFIGDSYTQGTGASAPEKRWVSLVAAAKGWGFDNLGRGGTGYLSTSDERGCGLSFCPNFGGMIGQAVAAKPSTVVVSGGQNDFTAFNETRPAVIEAINKTYADLRAKLPNTKIVAVGPSTPWGVNPDVEAYDQAVQDAAKSVGATYVSLINPDVIVDSMLVKDGAHVNDEGHKAIAERVISALR